MVTPGRERPKSRARSRARLRVAAVAVLVGLVGLVTASAASAVAPVDPAWPVAATYYPITAEVTGWSQKPQQVWQDPDGSTATFNLGEGYWNGTGATLTYSATWTPSTSTTTTVRWLVEFSTICTSTTGSLTYVSQGIRSGPSSSATTVSAGVQTTGGTSAHACGAGTPAGLRLVVSTSADGTTASNVPRIVLAWYPGSAFDFPAPSMVWCREMFGVDYTADTLSLAPIAGATRTAASVGCDGDYLTDPPPDDGSADFATVCAGAPQAQWLSFAWLGPWVGHYASCLFVPRGGWDRLGVVAAAYTMSPASSLSNAVGGLGAVEFEGSCGQVVGGTLMGAPFAVSTCDAPWNDFDTPRLMIGIGLIVAAGFYVIRVLAQALGLPSLGGRGDDDE